MLPQGVSQNEWSKALSEFRATVGSQWVFVDADDLALYRDAYSPIWGEPDERQASAAVSPVEVSQVQAIVRTANTYKIPIYPISTGRNLGYGGSAPVASGCVVLDLKRMNKIISVDDKRHVAIVEPGVSYFDLYRHLEDNKLKTWLDCAEPGWGSLIGNALDHGVGQTLGYYRDHFNAHCGMEVVLPNGELMRTGMGALPTARTFADFRYGFGPYVDGLFSQGNFGVVTKMGFHTMPQPEAYISRSVAIPRYRDLIPMTEILNELEYLGIIGMPIVSSPLFPMQFTDPWLKETLTKPEIWSTDILDRFAAQKQTPFWLVELQFYGSRKGIEANWAYAQERIAKDIPGVKFGELDTLSFPLTAEQADAVRLKVAVGIPNLEVFSLGARTATNPNPADGHLLFSPILARSGEEVIRAQKVFWEALQGTPRALQFTPLSQPYTWIYRSYVLATGFAVSRTNDAINRESRDAMAKLVKLGAENGFGEYRAPPYFQDMISSLYNYNDHALRRFIESLKDAVDPNGIMSPGRYGVWPKHLRPARP